MSNIPEPSPELMMKFHELNNWRNQRTQQYGQMGDQLNMLFDDIDAGLFGDQAKTGKWYQHIKQIKDSIQKPDVASIQADIATLMAQNNGQQ
jgi:hypothetical protein